MEVNHQPARQVAAVSAKTSDKQVCPTCGASNKGDARFCDQCGEKLEGLEAPVEIQPQRAPSPPKPKATKPPKESDEAQPRIGLYVAAAIAAVVALYLLSVLTGDPSDTPPIAPQSAPSAASSGSDIDSYLPEDAGLASSLSATKAAIAGETDPPRKQALLEELVQSYAGAGRLDLAGREQEALAAELNTSEAWATAGNMHFDWMEGQSGPERVKSAQRAARAYEKSLELDGSNLDVRTDLGVAYLNDPSSPMLAIQNTNLVLEADSNHVQANFNKGVMLAHIGRTEEAVRLFRKVMQLAGPGEPAHERAKQVLSQLGAE
ncbi:MAG TPA: zinc ribbon domain-containing protein [Rhodothermales bacterium]|nr:zinc ribbon domain-containing protein [Rhodothermales bacterium]